MRFVSHRLNGLRVALLAVVIAGLLPSKPMTERDLSTPNYAHRGNSGASELR